MHARHSAQCAKVIWYLLANRAKCIQRFECTYISLIHTFCGANAKPELFFGARAKSLAINTQRPASVPPASVWARAGAVHCFRFGYYAPISAEQSRDICMRRAGPDRLIEMVCLREHTQRRCAPETAHLIMATLFTRFVRVVVHANCDALAYICTIECLC